MMMSTVAMKSSEAMAVKVLLSVRDRQDRILARDEPAMRLVRIAFHDGVAQFLEDTDLQRHEWILPRHAVQAQGRETRIGRLRRLAQHAGLLARRG